MRAKRIRFDHGSLKFDRNEKQTALHNCVCPSIYMYLTTLCLHSITSIEHKGWMWKGSICRYIQQNLNNPFGLHPQAASLACGELSSFISVTLIYHEFLSDSTVLFDYNFSY